MRFGLALAALTAVLLAAPGAEARNASIVVDFETGQVLQEVNADTRNHPASLVKMMTLYLAFEALERGNLTLDQELPVSRRAAGMPPSKLGLKAGDTITVRDVILALVTKSANDTAVVMAEALGTKETRFAQIMTKKARKLGMKRTSFRNASGLPNRRQLSTARDMAALARALIRDFPKYYDYFSTVEFRYNDQRYRNHNNLLRKYEGADGLKTGYIRASGFNLAASAVRDGRRLIAVVFGGQSPSSRDNRVARLLDKGFARAAALPLIAKVEPMAPHREASTLARAEAKPEEAEPTAKDAAKEAGRETAEVTDAAQPGPVATAPADTAITLGADTGQGDIGLSEDDAPERGWGVQVGAYYRYRLAENAAIKAAARIPELLGDTRVYVPYIKGRRGRIHRARLLGLSEANARGACQRLESLKTDCLVVRDRSTVALEENQDRVAIN